MGEKAVVISFLTFLKLAIADEFTRFYNLDLFISSEAEQGDQGHEDHGTQGG